MHECVSINKAFHRPPTAVLYYGNFRSWDTLLQLLGLPLADECNQHFRRLSSACQVCSTALQPCGFARVQPLKCLLANPSRIGQFLRIDLQRVFAS